jgi:thymidylate synthase
MDLHRFGIEFRLFVGEILDLNQELEEEKKITSDTIMQIVYDYVTSKDNLKDIHQNIKEFCDKYEDKNKIIEMGICIVNEIKISALNDEMRKKIFTTWKNLNKKKKQAFLDQMKKLLLTMYPSKK